MAAKGRNLGKVTFSRREKTVCALLGLLSPVVVVLFFGVALAPFGADEAFVNKINNVIQEYALKQRAYYMDSRFQSSQALAEWTPRLRLLTVDDETLADKRFNRWPIPRERFAEMIEFLEGAKVRAIGLDVLFSESQNAAADRRLAEALKKSPNTVLVDAVTSQKGQLAMLEPLPVLTEGWSKDARLDRIGLTYEVDPVISVPLVAWVNDQARYSFDALLAARALSIVPTAIEDHSTDSWGSAMVQFGTRKVPVINGAMQVNYQWRGAMHQGSGSTDAMGEASTTEDAVTRIPMAALWDMSAEERSTFFKDKIVLVGVTALAGEDIKNTPIGRMSGVEVHLNALLTLLSGQFLVTVTLPWLVLVSVVICAIVGFTLPRIDPRISGVLIIVLLGALATLLPASLVLRYNLWLPPALPCYALALTYASGTVYLIRAERRAKILMKSLFEKATPVREEDVINFLLSGKTEAEDFETALEVKERTVLFSDIRDYTVMSERMDADRVMKTLNMYYSAMQIVINECGGKIWEYVGDAQMVIFGEKNSNGRYPPECQVKPEYANMNPADQATHAAINMEALLEKLNREARTAGMPVLDIGIGINSGPVSLGTIKNKGKLVFAAIGDTTNVAARMQAMSKDLKCRILLSESTYRQLEDVYLSEKVENVKVKGKAEPMTVFRIFAGQAARNRETAE